jgi:hypothetical protein
MERTIALIAVVLVVFFLGLFAAGVYPMETKDVTATAFVADGRGPVATKRGPVGPPSRPGPAT